MALYSAADLSEQLFQYLLRRHFQCKEKGEEFYFLNRNGFEVVGEEITTTFWFNPVSEGQLRALYPREASAIFIPENWKNWLNLSVTLEGEVCFWIIIDNIFNMSQLCRKIGLEHNNISNRTEKRYASNTSTWPEQLDLFFAEDFYKINDFVLNGENKGEPNVSYPINPIDLNSFEKSLLNTLQNRNVGHLKRSDWGEKSTTGLLSFECWNFRGIDHLKVDDVPANAPWIFLTGENGFGKSSVLQALALGLIGAEDLSKKDLGETWLLTAEWFEGRDAFVNTIYGAQTVKAYTRKKNFAAYGSSRLQIRNNTEPLKQNDASAVHLFDPTLPMLNIENELIRAKSYRGKQFGYLVDLIKSIIPDIEKIDIVTGNNYEEVLYYEKNREGGVYEAVHFNQLAAGFRNLIALVGDIYIRLSAGQPGPVSPKDLTGIILIDEIELYLHPKYQKMLPGKLSEAFPKVQFVVSTHSPIPLLGAPPHSIVYTVIRTPETGITIQREDIDFSKLLPNSILTSPVFGFDEILPESASGASDVETEDDYNSVKGIQDLKEKLNILRAKMNVH